MHNEKIFKLVRAALLAALCFVMTRVIVIPAPTGYINLGDCGVLLSAWLLGPLYGGLAAGVGTMLADVLSGYASYAPATFVIKFVMAVAAAWIFQGMKKKSAGVSCVVGAVVAEIIMVAGYFAYESMFLGVGAAAAASIPANLLQGIVCAAAGVLLMGALAKSKALLVK